MPKKEDNKTAGRPAETSKPSPMGEVIQIDQEVVQKHLSEVVRSTVEETLNAMLDAEADQLCGAKRYEHSEVDPDPWTADRVN